MAAIVALTVMALAPAQAAAAEAAAPGAPVITSVINGDSQATIRFDAPESDGGEAITSYEYSISYGEEWVPASAAPGEDLVIGGLSNGTASSVSVRAVNPVGPGEPSEAVVARPLTVPDPPGVETWVPRDASVVVDIEDVVLNGGSWQGFEYTIDGGSTWIAPYVADDTFEVVGLENGTAYPLQVRVFNEAGPSAPSPTVTITPSTYASPPVITRVEPGTTSLTVWFDAPATDGGSPITEYAYAIDGWAQTGTITSEPGAPFTIDGLTSGTDHAIVVAAVNAAGATPSASVTARTLGAPAPPVRPQVGPGEVELRLNGELSQPLEVSAGDHGVTVVRDYLTLHFSFVDSDGTALVVDPLTGAPRIPAVGAVHVSGGGFEPGSTVLAQWFSTPLMGGELTVAADGTFEGVLVVPEQLEAGDHALQLSGVHQFGAQASVALGVTLLSGEAPTGTPSGSGAEGTGDGAGAGPMLAASGADMRLTAVAASMVVAGLGLVLAARRRETATSAAA